MRSGLRQRTVKTYFLAILILIAAFSVYHYFFIPRSEELVGEEPLNISFAQINVSKDNPRVYELVEISIKLNGSLSDPFNENDVNITSEIYPPNNEGLTIQAFLYQDYKRSLVGDREVLTPLGTPFWKIRFTPILEGDHDVKIYLYSRKKLVDSYNLRISVNGYLQNHGFAKLGEKYLVCDDGSDLFLIGQNVCWYTWSRKTYDYDAWFGKMAENGMNYARIWMAPWAFALEWSGKVGHYDLGEAWRLDYVLKLAEEKGIYLMLCIVNHGQLRRSDDWSNNPYNSARGGPLSSPEQFFTDPVAKGLFEKKLRYLVSRYAYSTHLLAWEFFNEVDLTDNYNPTNVASWHREMAEFLRAIDPYKHLVTTSFSSPTGGDLTWKEPGLDFTQTHMYGPSIRDLANTISREIERKLAAYEKPTLVGEFSADWRWSSISSETPYYYKDKDGVEIHEGIWASCMSSSLGTAMLWWWDVYVDPYNLYYHYKALRNFLRDVNFIKSNFSKLNYSIVENEKVNATNINFEVFGLSNSTFAMGWIRNRDYNWFNAVSNVTLRCVGNVDVKIFGLKMGRYFLEIWDTYSGEKMETVEVSMMGEELIVSIPPFIKDIAFKVIRK